MTRKDFEALAAALAKVRPLEANDTHEPEVITATFWRIHQWGECTLAVADVCESANPLFDRARFIKACEGE